MAAGALAALRTPEHGLPQGGHDAASFPEVYKQKVFHALLWT